MSRPDPGGRVEAARTCKLFIGGAYPRSESGRVTAVEDPRGRVLAQVARASRKDLRDAVEAAAKALPAWSAATPYLRGQILHRTAELMETRRDELCRAVGEVEGIAAAAAEAEVDAAIDRFVSFAGWTDKIASLLGGEAAVAGPYYAFATPEPIGVAAAIAPEAPSLLGLVSVLAPALAAGNAVVALASERNPLPAIALSEILGVSDYPPGSVNLLTGGRGELLPVIAGHRQIGVLGAIGLPAELAAAAGEAAAESLKRLAFAAAPEDPRQWLDHDRWCGPASLEPWLEMKAIWHSRGA
jgi:acyl-CoA reductase-like NAD-dependent aldehyde dehydrogenase